MHELDAPKESTTPAPENPKEDPAGIVSSGQKARAADVTEALAAIRALQDAQRKERAEADELEHTQK
jgi:hypothetical protein